MPAPHDSQRLPTARTTTDDDALRLAAQPLLHARLPAEALHGQVPKTGLPPTFRKAA